MSPSESTPSYLRTETAFKKSADLNTRWQFVQQNADVLGKDLAKNYSDGHVSTEDNEKLMEKLKNNPALRELFEAAAGIRTDTKKSVSTVRESVDSTTILRGKMTAEEVARAFPANVNKVLCSDGKTATRNPNNGYFYYPRATQAFYLAEGETGRAVGFDNTSAPKKKNLLQRIFSKDTDTQTESQRTIPGKMIPATELARMKDQNITQVAKDILGDGTYIDYVKLNTELADAVKQDMEGKFLEGGLIGIFQKNGNLAEVLNKLNPAQRSRVENQLKVIENELREEMKKQSGIGSFFKNLFGGMFGRRSLSYQAEVYSAKTFDGYKRQTSLIETAVVAALSAIITGGASITLLLGKMSLGIPVQRIPGLPKSVAADAASGGTRNAYDYESRGFYRGQTLDRNLASLSKRELQGSQENLSRLLKTTEEELRALVPDRIEKKPLNENVDMRNPELKRLWLRYMSLYYKVHAPDKPVTNKFISMVCESSSVEEFKKHYDIPEMVNGVPNSSNKRDIERGLSEFYKTGNSGLLVEMLNHPTKYLGLTSLAKSEMAGDSDESRSEYRRKYLGTMTQRNMRRPRETSYGDKIADITDRSGVVRYFENRTDVLDTYVRNIKKFRNRTVSAGQILTALGNGETRDAREIKAYNTSRNATSLEGNPLLKNGKKVLMVPVDTGDGIQIIGVVEECANLVVGPFIPNEFVMQENPEAKPPVRLALAINIGLGGGGGGGGNHHHGGGGGNHHHGGGGGQSSGGSAPGGTPQHGTYPINMSSGAEQAHNVYAVIPSGDPA